MKYQRTYTGEDGHTHFEEVDVPYTVKRAEGRETDLLTGSLDPISTGDRDDELRFQRAPRRLACQQQATVWHKSPSSDPAMTATV
ncbi:MAG: hypothetical protein VX107_06495, partial [Pseudomonadota bacterium]|nr:hypothetical protein [Pseudomonadota bacterium]